MRFPAPPAVLLAFCAALPAQAEPGFQSQASIIAAIQSRVEAEFRARGQDYQAEVLPLDPRLRLPECGQALETFFPQGRREAGTWSVGVRCTGGRPWTLYGQVRVKASVEVVVLSRALRQGHVIGPGDVALARKELAEVRGNYFTQIEQAVGLAARHGLNAGQVLNPKDLAAPKLIRRGEKVTLRAESGGYQISMSGEALSDAGAGERVRVRNDQSGRIVEGIAAGQGLVLVRP
jgi:flagella basal body P-ring formation protein FlgA